MALPAVLPPLVGVIAFLFLYGESGFVSLLVQRLLRLEDPPWRLEGAGAILLVHAYSMYVYFYLFTRAGLCRWTPRCYEAAASLGAGRWRTLRRVVLPLLCPALGGGALLTFMTALASFSAPYIFGGGFRVMTTQIVSTRLNGENELAMVETVSLTLLALLALLALRGAPCGRLGGGRKGTPPAPVPVRQPLGPVGARRCWLGSGRGAPAAPPDTAARLVRAGGDLDHRAGSSGLYPAQLRHPDPGPRAARPLAQQPLARDARLRWLRCVSLRRRRRWSVRRRVRGRRRASRGCWRLPWAVPGTVFAIALATAFSVHAPWAGRFILVGTVWILPLAYLVRNLPIDEPGHSSRLPRPRSFAR